MTPDINLVFQNNNDIKHMLGFLTNVLLTGRTHKRRKYEIYENVV